MGDVTGVIAARLSAARKVEFNSARAFTKSFNIPESTYSQHETGKRALSACALIEYSEWLGVDAGWLLTGKGLPYPNERECTEKQASLYQYLSEIDKNQLHDFEQRYLIQNNFSIVDVLLFKEVFVRIIDLAKQKPYANTKVFIECALDAYNSVVQTSVVLEEKVKIIDLSISSLAKGLLDQNQDWKDSKHA